MNRQSLIFKHLPYANGIAYYTCLRKGQFPRLFEDCKSVAAEALIKAIDSYDPASGASLKTWLTRTVRFAVIDFIRNENHLRLQSIPIMLNADFFWNSIELSYDGLEKTVCYKDIVGKCLFHLKHNQDSRAKKNGMEILLTYLRDGYKQKEIAEEQGCSKQNVSQIITRLRNVLKEHFKEEVGF